jgi:RNA-directed DNA polymerase
MRSYDGQGPQKTSSTFGGLLQSVVGQPRGYAGAQSSSSAQVGPSFCEVHNHLMEQMLSSENLRLAYKQVMRNRGASGVDGVTVEQLQDHLWKHWDRVKVELQTGTYRPAPVKRIEIPKADGGKRMLGVPTVLDRMIQQAMLQVLDPIFDAKFSQHSYGFRKGKRAHDAVKQAQAYIQTGHRYVVDMDLEKFFDRVNHDMLMARVARKIGDKRILKLIRSYLNAGAMNQGIFERSDEGTPQGGPLSPLLANILLDDLDHELTRRGLRFVRYADDCNIFVKTKRAGIRVMETVTRFVENKLKLKVNREKSAVDRPWNRKFLGFSFLKDKKATIRIAPKSLERMKDKIRTITSRTAPIPIKQRIEKLNRFMMGWVGYFQLASAKGHMEDTDRWIRRRLRMCLWKQWKRVRTRTRELRALGMPNWVAIRTASSRRGPWEMSRNINNALNNSYWESRGLKSLLNRYLELR